jgi:hypothetical protein
MIVYSFGFPGRFAEWCDAACVRLAERAVGPADLLGADTIEEVGLAATQARSAHAVIASRQPSARLCNAIAEAGGRFILAVDDPRAALRDLTSRRGLGFVDAVRAVARSCAAIVNLTGAAGALVLRADTCWTEPVGTLAAISRHFAFAPYPADLAAIAGSLGGPPPAPDRLPHDDWWAGLDERSRDIADGALGGYFACFGGGDIRTVTWERELFFVAQEPRTGPLMPAARPVDITGRSRCLIFGPSLTLPPGDWAATVSLGVSPEAVEMTYLIDIVAGARLAAVTVDPGADRRIEAELAFSVDPAFEQPIDIRVSNQRPAFDGRLAINHAVLTLRAPLRMERDT